MSSSVPEAARAAPAPRRRAARGRGPELRGELLRAATDLLSETGDVEAMSLRAVAGRVGVSVPSIYLHFADKEALLEAVCEEVFEALHARMRAAGEQAPDAFEGLYAQGMAYVHFALENPEQYRVLMMRRHDGPGADLEIATGAFGYLVASVRACVEQGVLAGEPVALAARLWAAAHGVAALLIAKPHFPWPDREAFISDTICMAGLGLAAAARLEDTPPGDGMPLPDLVARLDRLRG